MNPQIDHWLSLISALLLYNEPFGFQYCLPSFRKKWKGTGRHSNGRKRKVLIVLLETLFEVMEVNITRVFDYFAGLFCTFSNSHTFHYHLVCQIKCCPTLFASLDTLGAKFVVVPAHQLVLFSSNSLWVQAIQRRTFRRAFCNLQEKRFPSLTLFHKRTY